MEPFVLEVKSHIPALTKKVSINGDGFFYKGKFGREVAIPYNEISAFKYGIFWIRLDLTFGREYRIYIKGKNDEVVKLAYRSFFGKGVGQAHENYSATLQALHQFRFKDVIDDFLNNFREGYELRIGNVSIDDSGLTVSNKPFVKPSHIPWENVRTRDYTTYFCIFSEADAARQNYSFSYLEDWNSAVIYSVVRTILSNKGIESYE